MIKMFRLISIMKTLKNEGEVKVNNISIVLDGIGEAEICKDDQYQFTASNWYEVEEFLLENGITE